MKIKELNDDQKSYLVRMLDAHSSWGLIGAQTIIYRRQDWQEEDAYRAFEVGGRSAHSSKIWASKVAKYDPKTYVEPKRARF